MEVTMGLMATIRQWQSRYAQAYELDSLGTDDREALARDIALPATSFRRLDAGDRGCGGAAAPYERRSPLIRRRRCEYDYPH